MNKCTLLMWVLSSLLTISVNAFAETDFAGNAISGKSPQSSIHFAEENPQKGKIEEEVAEEEESVIPQKSSASSNVVTVSPKSSEDFLKSINKSLENYYTRNMNIKEQKCHKPFMIGGHKNTVYPPNAVLKDTVFVWADSLYSSLIYNAKGNEISISAFHYVEVSPNTASHSFKKVAGGYQTSPQGTIVGMVVWKCDNPFVNVPFKNGEVILVFPFYK